MDPALSAVLIGSLAALVGAFVGYWRGVGTAEARFRGREDDLLAELDVAVDVIASLRAKPAGRHLRLITEGA